MAKLRHDATFRLLFDCPRCGDTKEIARSRGGETGFKVEHGKLMCFCDAQYVGPKVVLVREEEPEDAPAPAA